MKKILYLIPRFTTGGAERLVLQYAKYFKEQNYQVAVASVVGGGELVKEFEKLGIEVFVSENKSWSSWQKLKKFVANYQPKIIHTHVFSADLAGYLLKGKSKWVSTQHNVENNASFWRQIIWQYILKSTDQVIAVSEGVYQFTKKEFKVPTNKLIKILNGVELDRYLNIDNSKILQSNVLNLAIIGRLEKQKGHEYLLRALAQLNFPWHLQIMGVGSLANKLKSQAEKLKIAKNISWLGVVNNVAEKLIDIEVVVQPSLWEGLSLAVMEAMSAGRLVITTPAGGSELIKDGETGLIIPAVDVSALAKILNLIWQDKEKYREICFKAREYAKKNFGIEKSLGEIEKIYLFLSA